MKFSIGSQVWICSLCGEITIRLKGIVCDVRDTGYSVLQFNPVSILEFPCELDPDSGYWLEQRGNHEPLTTGRGEWLEQRA